MAITLWYRAMYHIIMERQLLGYQLAYDHIFLFLFSVAVHSQYVCDSFAAVRHLCTGFHQLRMGKYRPI